MAKKTSAATFLDSATSEIRIIYPEIEEDSIILHLWNEKEEIAKNRIVVNRFDKEEEPNGPPIEVESVKIHQKPHMKNIILEIKGFDQLVFLRVAKTDLDVTSKPMLCPYNTIKFARVSDTYCAVQAETGTFQKYALVIFSFDKNIKIQPPISVDHKLSQVALFERGKENLAFFFENHSGKYHLNWVKVEGDWETRKKTIVINDLAPRDDAIIHAECFGNILVILSQDRRGRAGVANYYVLLYEISNGKLLKKRVVQQDFGCPISWDIHDEGVLALCNHENYAWVDLLSDSSSPYFDGNARLEGRSDITFARTQKDGLAYMIAWQYSDWIEANMFLPSNDNDMPSTASRTWKSMCESRTPSKKDKCEVLGNHIFFIHNDNGNPHVTHTSI